MIAAKKMVVLSESREAKTVLAERECTERKLRRDKKCADSRAASQANALLESRANIDRLTVSLKSAHIEHRREMDALKREHKGKIGRLQKEMRHHVENALAYGQNSAVWNIKASEMEALANLRLEKMKLLQDEVDGRRSQWRGTWKVLEMNTLLLFIYLNNSTHLVAGEQSRGLNIFTRD